MLSALLFCLVVGFAHAAETCFSPRLTFKPNAEKGLPSYISLSNAPVVVAASVPMPPVTVQFYYFVRSPSGTVTLALGTGTEANIVVESKPPGLLLGGASVALSQGEASFSALAILTEPLGNETGHRLVFSVVATDGGSAPIASVETGPLVFVDAADPTTRGLSSVRFGNYGLINRVEAMALPAGVALPYFYVEGLDRLGGRLGGKLELVSVTSTGEVSVTPSSGLVGDGVIEFFGAVLNVPTASTSAVVLSITVRSWINDTHFVTATAQSGPLTVRVSVPTALTRNEYAFFTADSFFKYDNVGNTAVLNVTMPPIVVQLYAGDLSQDVSFSGLIISASCPQAQLRGADALVVRGTAVFRDMAFVGTEALQAAVIQFRVGQQGSLPVQNQLLYSGAVSVTVAPVKGRHLSFAPHSQYSSAATSKTRVRLVNRTSEISGLGVQILDSAYRTDFTATLTIEAILVPLQAPSLRFAPSTITSVVSQRGLVTFPPMSLVGGNAGDTFRIRIRDPRGIRASIETETLTLSTDPLSTPAMQRAALVGCQSTVPGACVYSLEFGAAPRSSITAEDVRLFATVGVALSEVHVYLRGPFGEIPTLPSDAVPGLQVYTRTTSVVLAEADGNTFGVWRGDHWAFPCIRFSSSPADLLRLYFRATRSAGSSIPLPGVLELRTGFVTIAAQVSRAFGLRFGATSWISYEGQSTYAVVGVALPRIVIEVVDSKEIRDTSAGEPAVVTASLSAGNLQTTGSRVSVINGVATFDYLRIITAAERPILSFQIIYPTTRVDGTSLQTGSVIITDAPLRSVAMRMLDPPKGVGGPWVRFPNEPLTFPTISAVMFHARVGEIDSAAQTHGGVFGSATLAVRCSPPLTVVTSPPSLVLNASMPEINLTVSFPPQAYSGEPVWISLVVVGGSNTLMERDAVGLAVVRTDDASDTPRCLSLDVNPVVVVEMNTPLPTLISQLASVKSALAFMVGVQPSRVTISNIRSASGVNHSTVEQWYGSKVDVQLADPNAASIDRRSSAMVAAQLVALQPECDQQNLGIQAVYYVALDRGCDRFEFLSSLDRSLKCSDEGSLSRCQCYIEGALSQWGLVCREDESVQAEYLQMCRTLATCPDDAITSVCAAKLQAIQTNRLWLYGAVGGGVVVMAAVIVAKRRGVFKRRRVRVGRKAAK